MPSHRIDLHYILTELLGSENVYYQPPETVKMKYPCIVYDHTDENTLHADDIPYKTDSLYTVTSISTDPDSDIPNKLGKLRGSRFDRHFVSDNLHHYVYRLRYTD